MRQPAIAILLTALLLLACGFLPTPAPSVLPPEPSVFDSGQTAYGFFPTPPEATLESVLAHFNDLGRHADFVLLQPNIPWEDVAAGIPADAPRLTDIRNQVTLAHQNGLDTVFVVDPLNGLNRREFLGLPEGWEASFDNPEVRAAFTHFSLWIVSEFHPRFLGLASEINTYADAHPDGFPPFLSLYQEVYAAVKAESPETQVFVTFQWEDLNNLFRTAAEGRTAYDTNWGQVEAFEPQLDLWVISSYPFVAFPSGAEIPDDYYTPLLSRTDRPLAVAEGGYTSRPVGPFPGSPQDQVDYLTAIHSQIGSRLRFWVYLLLSDFDPQAYAEEMRRSGLDEDDINTLGMFSAVGLRDADGSPKPALEVWDAFRNPP
jgi:hypothetical protein